MKVLVVDDDNRVIEIITRSLKAENFVVDFALDRKNGFDKAKNNKYDVIVLDIMLGQDGKNSGFDIISGLRALGINTPILIVSSRTLIEDRILGLDLGADDYLIKNFSPAELVARVKALLRRRNVRRSNVLKCGKITINLSNLSVIRNDQQIKLSKKEFGILVELVRRKNTVVTREELIESTWGDSEKSVLSNTIDVHIRSLRGKIDKPFKKKLIKTIRGYGYTVTDS
ncbi:MAG: response regulator transcription factor [Candidatus Peregrinibacteria bacterium]|nr:response regulator transcription factor [Candidatus Peregrinibacteria bacterium]